MKKHTLRALSKRSTNKSKQSEGKVGGLLEVPEPEMDAWDEAIAEVSADEDDGGEDSDVEVELVFPSPFSLE